MMIINKRINEKVDIFRQRFIEQLIALTQPLKLGLGIQTPTYFFETKHISIQSNTTASLQMDDDLFRILVATDNHLGHLEKDPIRGNDSFASFEDVLITAREKKVDCILLAGDMFHENKPSRNTMHSTIELLRKYCHGNNPVYTEVLSDPKEVLKPNFGTVNYEDPYHAIALPIYAIHGNHDDPSRECSHFQDSLSALDILAASNLVNYIGKSENVDDIEITPLLIRKGGIHIAIYALGAIRDERLNRMWNLKQVKFVRPAEEVNKQKYFNIFLLHQNRDYGRGSKNCIHESMIPEWMDLVIWGNEHEAIPRLVESLVGTYRIYQPGSSVVTSLCDRESLSFPKSMGLIEIRRTREFRLTTIPFTQLRLFKYAEASLSDDRFGLDPNDPKVEEKIKKALIRHVGQLIKSTLEEYKDKVPALTNSSTTAAATSNSTTSSSIPAISVSSSAQLQAGSGTRTIIASESPSELQSQRRFILKKPRQILIRLRVEHSGFPTVNTVRLGTQFINDVANPTDLILFAKQKARSLNDSRATEKGDSKNKKMTHENLKMLIHEGADEELQKIKIEDLVADSLQNSNKQLNLLPENEMAKVSILLVLSLHHNNT